MNTDSRYQLVDRYLDGPVPNEHASALAVAVDADPDVLAYLCESAEMEAGLQKLLAPDPRAFAGPRIIPIWHWRRAGKWLSAGAAAAAALLAIAAVVLWPRQSTGGNGVTGARGPSLLVKRLQPGEQSLPLQQPGTEVGAEAMEEVEFRPGESLLQELKTLKLDWPNDKGIVSADEYLGRYLQAAGVTFPGGAGAHWLPAEGTARGPQAFVVTNTQLNLARVEEIMIDPVRCGPRFFSLTCHTWKFAAGTPIPPQFAGDKILSEQERKLPRPEPAQTWSTTPDNWIPGRLGYLHKNGRGEDLHSILQVANSRQGDLVLITGLFSTLPVNTPAADVNVHAAHASLEITMALRDGQEAVIRLGSMPDGDEWIISIQPHVQPLPQIIELEDVPGVIKFDPSVVTVKAGQPVRLVHRNNACPLQHNFILMKPGSLEAVGALADKMLASLDAVSEGYIPHSPDIVVAGKKLVGAKHREIIDFTAPVEPGDYPYACTFPGHWRVQNGILRVVK